MKFKFGYKLTYALAMITAVAVIAGSGMGVYANGTAKVSTSAGKVRSSASTTSETVASVTKGMELDIVASCTDSDGYTWYKILVNGSSYGYIRADLVTDVKGDIAKESASSSDAPKASSSENKSTDTSSASTDAVTATTSVSDATVNPSNVATVKVKGDAVTVRSGASTKTAKKTSVSGGTEFSVTGEATDADGKVWYQISSDSVQGFIRSDFLEVVSMVEEEPEVVDEEADLDETEPVSVNTDYEVRYEANSEGIEEWFLYDHNNGTKQSIDNINAVMQQVRDGSLSATQDNSTMKLVVIIMAAVIVLLLIIIAIIGFKLRGEGYEDYYEDDEEEDEDSDYPDKYEEEEEETPRRRLWGRRASRDIDYDEDEDEEEEVDEEEDEEEEEPVRERPTRPAKKSSWPGRGMLDVDDDMEFEFLDLD
ncbi:MAG: SH3 domain-containing protein [Lachnospiraceae bacterium]|nr:SH3 domain-containing protein [Lachnospiraceae bacterium]